MAILAGIDEAGYGPTLGPLVVSVTAFRVPDEHLDRSLWETLRESCTNTPSRSGRRLAIADSKKLFAGRKNMAALERAALVMLAVRGVTPGTFAEMLDAVGSTAVEPMAHYPWYASAEMPLPTCLDVGDLGTRVNAVRRDCRDHDVEFATVMVAPMLEEEFNRLVGRTRNKSSVLMTLVLQLVHHIVQSFPGERVRVCVDRLGGRVHYREALMTSLSGRDFHVLEESAGRSAYRFTEGGRVCDIEFATDGEDRHFPTALASIYSKYVRELFMKAFNSYWGAQVATLKPTAGYYTDAKRWLAEVGPVLDELKIDRRKMVRSR